MANLRDENTQVAFEYADLVRLMGMQDGDLFDPYHFRIGVGIYDEEFDLRQDPSKIYVSVDDSDLFAWGYSGDIPIRPDEIDDLEQAYLDYAAATGDTREAARGYTALWCARTVGRRPQGACYHRWSKKAWPLFDACGPEREAGVYTFPCRNRRR